MDREQLSIDKCQFGPFEFDRLRGDLRKNGHSLKLQPQPAKVLRLLLSQPGQVVLRDDLRRELWGADTFVDFERGLNFSIRQLRATLNDDARNPRYIETVSKRGYKFVAPVVSRSDIPMQAASVSPTAASSPAEHQIRRHRTGVIYAAGLLALIAAGFILQIVRQKDVPKVISVSQITNDGRTKIPIGSSPVYLVTDGPRLYFSEFIAGTWVLSQVSSGGGETSEIRTLIKNASVADISPLRSRLLLVNSEMESPLWQLPIPTGSAQRVGNLIVSDAAWSPDGQKIIYCRAHDLYEAEEDGRDSRRIATFPLIPKRPRWSPDQKRIRLTLYNSQDDSQSLWELAADGSRPHPLLSGKQAWGNNCCGAWTVDGKYYIYQAANGSSTNIWALPESSSPLHGTSAEPVQLTSGPVSFLGPCPSVDGKGFFVKGHQPRGELVRYDRTTSQLSPFLSGISAEGLDFSSDGQWVTYVSYPESALWRSRVNGNQRVRLTLPGVEAALPHWSPDHKTVAFSGSLHKGPWKSYIVSASGADSPQPVIRGEGPEFDPNWSPDGKTLVFADSIVSRVPKIHLIDMGTRFVTTLPASEHMFSPRWSPDGQFIAALPTDSIGLNVFNRARGVWRHLLRGQHVSYPSWSSDSKFINFCSLMELNSGFYRVRITDGEVQKVADVPGRLAPGNTGWWTGLAPDGSPLLLRDVGIEEIYSLTVKW